MDMVRKLGDTYPPITLEDDGIPIDIPEGTTATYDFQPDSKRAKVRKKVPLSVDTKANIIEAPHPRTTGLCSVTICWPNGECETLLQNIRVVKDL